MRDHGNARTGNPEPHPYWASEEDNKKPTGRTKKSADMHATRDDNPRDIPGKRKAP
jgi:hypothetical protein